MTTGPTTVIIYADKTAMEVTMKRSIHILSAAAALLCCALALPAAAKDQASAKVTVQPAPTPSPEQAELAKLTAENQLADQRLKKKLQQLNFEKEELKAQYELEVQKQKNKTAALEAELSRTFSENKLNEEKRKAEIEKLETDYQKLAAQNKLFAEQAKALSSAKGEELAKLTLDNKLADEKNNLLMNELSIRIENLRAQNNLNAEKERADLIAYSSEKNEIDLKLKRLDLEERTLKIERMNMDARITRLEADIETRKKKAEWKTESNKEPVYTSQPFKNGKLIISDRRIALNGPIYSGIADYVTERIHYFNNISTQPIFIVIDMSPGGSVMAGYRIVKAMQASRAPISVVVKSYAASMAAIITTLADQSYVYPNAIILHHQMSSGSRGNMTQMKEQLEMAKEWERRLLIPLSKKVGMAPEALRKKMYEKNSDGDWEEFGDSAVTYKWATSVVDEIEETGIVKNPDDNKEGRFMSRMPGFELEEKTDEKGDRYVSLPRLDPFDFYFIYNPDRYYR
ncbi:MAG: hypothetical protein AUJ51_09235 [Elusimicrobia bacterium CG1_02_56_21]|nr:MAG: hypothetical protein AUJ51_09235 [Elusimicrobia bacterium CG1_02_56_21]